MIIRFNKINNVTKFVLNYRNLNQIYNSNNYYMKYFACNKNSFSTTTLNNNVDINKVKSDDPNNNNNNNNNSNSNGNDFTSGDYGGMLFFGGICLTTMMLGVWQISRYYWKIDLIENNKKAVKEPIINMNQLDINNVNDQSSLSKFLKDKVGKRVSLTGKYLHNNSVLLGPRSIPEGIMEKAQGMASNPQGFYIITPMVIKLNDGSNSSSSNYFFKSNNNNSNDDGILVYVNRGWIPSSKIQASAKSRDYSYSNSNSNSNSESESINITGIVAESEASGMFTPTNDLSSSSGSGDMNKLLWLEAKALIQSCSSSSSSSSSNSGSSSSSSSSSSNSNSNVSIDDDPIIINRISNNATSHVYPIAKSEEAITKGGGDHYVTPFTHLVYAVTWLSLTLFGTFMTYSMFRGKLKRRMRLRKQQQQQSQQPPQH